MTFHFSLYHMDFTIVIADTPHPPGNILDYSNPRNSIAQQVICSRKGIPPPYSSLSHISCENAFLPLLPCLIVALSGLPISLCALYLGVALRLGIPLEGLGMPGHFILRLRASLPPSDWIYFDAFRAQNDSRGLMLEAEVLGMLPIMRVPDGGDEHTIEHILRKYRSSVHPAFHTPHR